MTIQGAITEGDIANYLANTPGFFERQAELLALGLAVLAGVAARKRRR